MEISFSQSFLTDLERIDNNVVIDECEIGGNRTGIHVVCHENLLQACIEGIEGECERLDFYYNGGLAFTITGEGIIMNPERTIFEINLPSTPKATIECTNLTDDTRYLESPGNELGNSLYKDIKVSDNSLIWKESIGKYIIDRGLQDNHSYDVELLDTKSGILEERPIRFKSYQGITLDQGNWIIDTTKKSSVVKHDVYDEVSSSTFFVWDSPMIDATVNLEEEPECINNLGEYLDPGNVVFGNTDCFQYINFQSSLVGFRVTGTEGSKVSILMNKESSNGNYTSFDCTIEESGVAEVRFSDLPFYHFNGVQTIGPSRITKVESIQYLEETVDEYIPNPEKTYVVELKNMKTTIKFNGVCDYIEYEKYLGEIKEIGRGTDHINSIPELDIELVTGGSLLATIDSANKQISVRPNIVIGNEINSSTYRVVIANNINVDGNILTTSPLYSDYNVRIEQTGIIWKISTSPDYINEDGHGIYTLDYTEGSKRKITILTNRIFQSRREIQFFRFVQDSEDYFTIGIDVIGSQIIDGERWNVYEVTVTTKSENKEGTWRPKTSTGDPHLIRAQYLEETISSASFYAIQLREISDKIQVWEETLLPGKFSKVESGINLYNTLNKNFIVVKKVTAEEENIGSSWYYYDLSGQNRFYITDTSSQITNTGSEFLLAGDSAILDLGTGTSRTLFSRVINVNRSDIIGSVGTLTITESPAYPGSWRDLIDNNTINIEVTRELNNIYIEVGDSEMSLGNEDFTVTLSRIQVFNVYVRSNFKYIAETFGYLRFLKNDGSYDSQQIETFTGYNNIKKFTVALTKLDTKGGLDESYIEFRSGSLVRKVQIAIDGPDVYHSWYMGGSKPNLIRIFNNESVVPIGGSNYTFTSTTTPKISFSGVSGVVDNNSGEPDPVFSSSGYNYHNAIVTLSIPNSLFLSRSKYPMKSFGSVNESSLSYSELEAGPLKYGLYMKGKEHYLWCVKNLGGFSSLSKTGDKRVDMVLDAKGENGKIFYIVSRYDINNRTFITEYPEETDFKIKRGELEADIKISPQQNIGLDERSQIEYAIPVQVSCNVENNGGNIFLGSIDYVAKTEITNDSLSDIIDVNSEIYDIEGIDASYIKSYITNDRVQNLSVMIFQLGTDKTIFDLYSSVPHLGIWATSNYIIPEIGSDYTLTSFSVTKSTNPYGGGGEDIVHVYSEWDSKYFWIKVDSDERVVDNGSYFHWYPVGSLPMGKIQNTTYTLNIKADYTTESGLTGTYNKYLDFIKYGCNYGLYVDGKIGLGVTEDHNAWGSAAHVRVPSNGGSILIHAGIVYAVNGIDEFAEALAVPAEYKFIGENQPLEFSWDDGNLDDVGNLRIVLPPRTREEYGDKVYVLEVTQPYEYYPLKLYIHFYQSSYNTGEDKYYLMFLEDKKYIYSDGTVEGDDKFYFVCNMPEEEFKNVSFDFDKNDSTCIYPTGGENIYFDNYHLEEVERSYREGYVKFKFMPNGSWTYMKGKIAATYKKEVSGATTSLQIGSIRVEQGYYCLKARYYNIKEYGTSSANIPTNYISRVSPALIALRKTGSTYNYYSELPCKSSNDNSDSTEIRGRGIIRLTAHKKEFFSTSITDSVDLKNVFIDSVIDYISPENIFENYELTFTSRSSNDYDAKANSIFNNGNKRATNTDFSSYTPYIELNYEVKEDYIREYCTINAVCKMILKDPDRGGNVEFYFSTAGYKDGSDQPQNVEDLEFSDYNLKWDYKGGLKQVSYTPASFYDMLDLSLVNSDVSWINATKQVGSNYIYFKATENKTTSNKKAFYRNTQAKIDVIDDREHKNIIMKSFYFNLEQEPDVQQTSSGGGDTPTSDFAINLIFKNDRSDEVKFTGEISLQVVLEPQQEGGESVYASINTILPDADITINGISVPANNVSLEYTTYCTSSTATPNAFEGATITACEVMYQTADGQSSIDLLPYAISGEDGKFKKDGSYTITFSVPSE